MIPGVFKAIALLLVLSLLEIPIVSCLNTEGYHNSFRYLNTDTQAYRVKSLPDVEYDLGEFYSGSIAINASEPDRNLFFAFKPTTGPPVDDLTIWFSGGPGCSSLIALLQENGPWVWQPGTEKPQANPYTWSNITNVLWVDQPVGAGFSTGEVRAKSEIESGIDFVNWLKNFEELFGIRNYRIFLSGESYAGVWVPYIAQGMLEKNDAEYYNLSGALLYDATIGFDFIQTNTYAGSIISENKNFFNLNDSTYSSLQEYDERCGITAYREKYATFPASGIQPPDFPWAIDPLDNTTNPPTDFCATYSHAVAAAIAINPCFSIYSINLQCPVLWDVLNTPTQGQASVIRNAGQNTYFNRTDVKTAMHAPQDVNWQACGGLVLKDNLGIPPILGAFASNDRGDKSYPNCERRFRFSGCNKWLGFDHRPTLPVKIEQPDILNNPYAGAQGVMGVQNYERGLMFTGTYAASHMGPQSQPRTSLKHLQWVLGMVETL